MRRKLSNRLKASPVPRSRCQWTWVTAVKDTPAMSMCLWPSADAVEPQHIAAIHPRLKAVVDILAGLSEIWFLYKFMMKGNLAPH